MSTSLLYHAFGIRGYELKKTEIEGGEITFHVKQYQFRCPCCNGYHITLRGTRLRRYLLPPIGSKKAFVCLPLQRVYCKDCGALRRVSADFAEGTKRYTKAFRKYALALLSHSTVQDVARHLGVGWDLIKEIDKAALKKFEQPNLKNVRLIAVDEICFGKGHKYLTIVLDLETGKVLFVGKGKSGESLAPFFKRLKRAKAKIEAVASDMSPAYISALTKNLPDATQVADPFHLVKLFNEKLSKLRRDLYNQLEDEAKKRPSKGADGFS